MEIFTSVYHGLPVLCYHDESIKQIISDFKKLVLKSNDQKYILLSFQILS